MNLAFPGCVPELRGALPLNPAFPVDSRRVRENAAWAMSFFCNFMTNKEPLLWFIAACSFNRCLCRNFYVYCIFAMCNAIWCLFINKGIRGSRFEYIKDLLNYPISAKMLTWISHCMRTNGNWILDWFGNWYLHYMNKINFTGSKWDISRILGIVLRYICQSSL